MSPALIWPALAAAFVIGLAGVLRMAGPATLGDDGLNGVIRLPERMTLAILGLFGLAALVFLTDLVRRWLTRRRAGDGEPERLVEPAKVPAWLRTLTQILTILNAVVIAYLLWRGIIPFGGLLLLGGGMGSVSFPPVTVPRSAPPMITWTFGVLALAAALGALALALRLALGDREPRSGGDMADAEPPAALETAVEESVEDLQSEPDARRAIIRCYARFERAAADSGVERKPWLTPMEFMREVLARLSIPRGAVPTLTRLFELARFSDHALGSAERDRALAALQDIKTAIEMTDAPAR